MRFPEEVFTLIDRLEEAGFEAWIVGGAVRDAYLNEQGLLKLPLHDIDLTTNAHPDQIEAVFSDCKTLDVGRRYGTIRVLWGQSVYEITSYRSEGAYQDGRHPDLLQFSDHLEEDLIRRDFTMNAMAYHPKRGLVDLFGGRADLSAGRLRAVGEARERLMEDGLRMLRAVRFSARLDLTLETELREAILALHERVGLLSVERCLEEMTRMLEGPRPTKAMNHLNELGLLESLLPELTEPLVEGRFERLPEEAFYRWACLFLSLPSTEEPRAQAARQCLRRLKSSLDLQKKVGLLLSVQGPWPDNAHEARLFLHRYGTDAVAILRFQASAYEMNRPEGQALARAGHLVEEVLQQGLATQISDLAIGGDEILQMGYNQGRQIGALLEDLLEAVMAGQVENHRSALTRWIQDHAEPTREGRRQI